MIEILHDRIYQNLVNYGTIVYMDHARFVSSTIRLALLKGKLVPLVLPSSNEDFKAQNSPNARHDVVYGPKNLPR